MQELFDAKVDWIHLDVMDGQFVPPITFGADLAKRVCAMGNVPVEAHLMTFTPEAHFEAFAEAGCKRIIFHAEATAHSHRLVQRLHAMGVEAGVAINPGTSVEAIAAVLADVDLALVMTVNPGWGGQMFIGSALKKVERIREAYPHLDVQVDGGIDPTTLPVARRAGANVYVAGSFLVRSPSIRLAIEELRRACG